MNQATNRQPPIPADAASKVPASARAAARDLLAAGARVERQCERIDDATLIVTGSVIESGGDISRCWISIGEDGLEGDCSCYQRRDCAHIAALLLASPERPPAPAGQTPVRPATPSPSRLIYVLDVDHRGHGRPALFIETWRMTTQHEQTVLSGYELARADRDEQPAYITPEDLRALRRLARRPQPADVPHRARLAFDDSELLGELIDRGVLRLSTAEEPTMVRGSAAPGRVCWKALSDGTQRLEMYRWRPATGCRCRYSRRGC